MSKYLDWTCLSITYIVGVYVCNVKSGNAGGSVQTPMVD
jgi:hypothetical protein